jgi:4-hydroxybenzoate polyprenyltransferase
MTQAAVPVSMSSRLREFAGDIKLAHTVFAMPFALLACVLASRRAGGIEAGHVLLVIACMVLARSFAMGMNRLLDAELDGANPRTRGRAIPAGRLSRRFVAGVTLACALLFVACAAGFGLAYGNWLPAMLAVPALAFVGAYPLLKRFTRLCHYYLGAALGLAPICAWIAVAGTPGVEVLLLASAVLCWTAGFDILYATADVESDRATGVFSVPARLGVPRALWVARLTHASAVVLLAGVGVWSDSLGAIWFGAVGIVVAMLIVEHALVRADDLSRLDVAFFVVNGCVAITLGAAGIVDAMI